MTIAVNVTNQESPSDERSGHHHPTRTIRVEVLVRAKDDHTFKRIDVCDLNGGESRTFFVHAAQYLEITELF